MSTNRPDIFGEIQKDKESSMNKEVYIDRKISIDFDEYINLLKISDLNEEQRIEYNKIIFSIILNFVDLGFGIHPNQSEYLNRK